MTNLDPHQDSAGDPPPGGQAPSGLLGRVGILLILLSGVLWFSLFAIPFLPLTLGQKAGSAGAVFASVQIAWWTGAAFLGPQAVARLKSWYGRRKTDSA